MAFRLLPEAEVDLDEIWHCVFDESGNTEVANRLIGEFTDRFWLLGENPQLGRRRDNDLREGLRSFPVQEYVILYRADGSDSIILHVFHGRRDLESLLPHESPQYYESPASRINRAASSGGVGLM